MTRFEEFKDVLDNQNYFKLVCGAGNKDADLVEKLTFIYTMAGALGMDMAADEDVVKQAVRGIERAKKYLKEKKNAQIKVRPFITVSVGMPGDHHVRKAIINDSCVACDACIPVCPTDAIPEQLTVIEDLCIGCGACEAACHFGSIDYSASDFSMKEVLPPLLELGADNVELHAAIPGHETFLDEWKAVNDCVPDNYISLSIDRNHLSNTALLERIDAARSIAGERTIIQADGVPMGGTSGDLSKTIQAVACAQQINLMVQDDAKRKRKDRDVKILLSGGTNAHTRPLALEAGVEFHGVAIGTFARKQIKEFIDQDGFLENDDLIEKAVAAAKKLVDVSVQDNNNIVSLN